MEALFFENMLNRNSFGYAYLAEDATILTANQQFSQFALAKGHVEGKSLAALFPEMIGLEPILGEIANGQRFSFALENINRENGQGNIHYFNIAVYHTLREDSPLFCLIEDVTRTATLFQQVNHQQNEIALLEGMLRAQNGHTPIQIWGNSSPIERVKKTIEKLAKIPSATILLSGESGTGKSMVAKVLHYTSQGEKAPFVEINCAAIQENLLESELFGYEKGAFTNALSSKEGLLETADGGTLFLDEIGEMPAKLQAKLLSFLESRRFRRLGSTQEKTVNLRLITATNRNLGEMVKKGEFREDLYYRLSVVNIELPPLRVLGKDILTIAQNFINALNINFQKHVIGFSTEAKNKLQNHHWPGNVRELRNAIERAMIFVESNEIQAEDLQIGTLNRPEPSTSPLERFTLPPEGLSFDVIEKRLLEQAMSMASRNQSKAAKLLQMSRDTFRYRLEKYGLI